MTSRFVPIPFTDSQKEASKSLIRLYQFVEADILQATAPSREQSLALTKLEEAVMWTNRALAVAPSEAPQPAAPITPEEAQAKLDSDRPALTLVTDDKGQTVLTLNAALRNIMKPAAPAKRITPEQVCQMLSDLHFAEEYDVTEESVATILLTARINDFFGGK